MHASFPLQPADRCCSKESGEAQCIVAMERSVASLVAHVRTVGYQVWIEPPRNGPDGLRLTPEMDLYRSFRPMLTTWRMPTSPLLTAGYRLREVEKRHPV